MGSQLLFEIQRSKFKLSQLYICWTFTILIILYQTLFSFIRFNFNKGSLNIDTKELSAWGLGQAEGKKTLPLEGAALFSKFIHPSSIQLCCELHLLKFALVNGLRWRRVTLPLLLILMSLSPLLNSPSKYAQFLPIAPVYYWDTQTEAQLDRNFPNNPW